MIVHLPAYIGPGAGFAFAGSVLSVVLAFLAALGSFCILPFRMLLRAFRGKQGYRKAKVGRLIFVGLDGLDAQLTERYMEMGLLPNLVRLKETGSYSRLRTTYPALSPVAWSTFATGVSPAKHNIFDFLNRSLKSYAPELVPSKVSLDRHGRPLAESRQRSTTFWKLLGNAGIQSTILRVPITFPPEEFDGRQLSAMCTPDLRGTQGSFSWFAEGDFQAMTGGNRYPLLRSNGRLAGVLEGPEGSKPVGFSIEPETLMLRIGTKEIQLARGQYSDWVKIRFRAGWVGIRGIVRFLVTAIEPFAMYATPIQIDPESPALPISFPGYYAAYLAKMSGAFSTLGMAEDTWARNEGVINDQQFLAQAYLTFAEREAMLNNALERTKKGVVACVFDTSDRVQHMFFRGMDSGGGVVRDMYERMDALVGRVMRSLDEQTVLVVLSDHGFCHFRRAMNVNRWLVDEGYMLLDGNGEVDWARTRAYFVGLSGLYVNRAGREAKGIVGDSQALAREVASKLTGLRDGETLAIRKAHLTRNLYRGPYLEAAPDLILGFAEGYRASWDAAAGRIGVAVFDDNDKAWSGDHCVDPELVPGVLFCSQKFAATNPGIEDMAATALDLFGVEIPKWMEGKSVFGV